MKNRAFLCAIKLIITKNTDFGLYAPCFTFLGLRHRQNHLSAAEEQAAAGASLLQTVETGFPFSNPSMATAAMPCSSRLFVVVRVFVRMAILSVIPRETFFVGVLAARPQPDKKTAALPSLYLRSAFALPSLPKRKNGEDKPRANHSDGRVADQPCATMRSQRVAQAARMRSCGARRSCNPRTPALT